MEKLSSPSKLQVPTDANASSTAGDTLADESISSVDKSYPSSYSIPGKGRLRITSSTTTNTTLW